MIYPSYINKNDIIAVTAPSDGMSDDIDMLRMDSAKANFEKLGFKVIETENVRCSINGRSSSAKNQAKQLEALYLNQDVKAIICAAGGEFLLEMLPFVNFDIIKNNPKWLQGYSDPTGLLYTITTSLDIATVYANNFKAFAMVPWHKSLQYNLDILEGKLLYQESFDKFEKDNVEYLTGMEGYNLSYNVNWKNLNNEKNIDIKGRIIGGCLDVLNDIFGTRYDKTKEFIQKYKKDGIIWYFDNYGLSSEQVIRTMWKFKQNGMFDYCKGIIFGRIFEEKTCLGITFENAIKHALNELKLPIIIDVDVGHVSPRLTIINGAIANVKSNGGKGSIEFFLK